MKLIACLVLSVLMVAIPAAANTTAGTQANTVERYLQASKAAGKKANRLLDEVSPYLLQHAYNPVQWYAWGEEAFARAKKENKPIFLSIGYATCHWCHVMARESFENDEIADILNRHFISIKVDREERPDIDAVYMSATQLLNGYGGWPMTVFLNHALEPFYAGTYLPPDMTDGRRGLKQVLLEIHRLWQHERERIERIADQVTGMIRLSADIDIPARALAPDIHSRVLNQLSVAFDDEHGGFGNAPKFPGHGIYAFLLEQSLLPDADGEKARAMLSKTLDNMAWGGIYDQLGGGFHRYSVDAEWRVPHFEKMLYSQALLALAYAGFYEIEKRPLYKRVARETLDFVLREMTAPEGGFYSALNADSESPDREGVVSEGACYLWSEKQLAAILSEQELAFVRDYYSIESNGNIASDPHEQFRDLNILYINETYRGVILEGEQRRLLESAGQKLKQQRMQRPRPLLDDKIITAWNGMMITALAKASVIFDEKEYLDAATRAADFVADRLLDARQGILLRRARNARAGGIAGLSDYAWYIHGLLALYEATEQKSWLQRALRLAAHQDRLFLDGNSGGYYETSGEDENLLFRSKSIRDGALPSANAIAYANLKDFRRLGGDAQWQQRADAMLRGFAGTVNDNPVAAAMFLSIAVPLSR